MNAWKNTNYWPWGVNCILWNSCYTLIFPIQSWSVLLDFKPQLEEEASLTLPHFLHMLVILSCKVWMGSVCSHYILFNSALYVPPEFVLLFLGHVKSWLFNLGIPLFFHLSVEQSLLRGWIKLVVVQEKLPCFFSNPRTQSTEKDSLCWEK